MALQGISLPASSSTSQNSQVYNDLMKTDGRNNQNLSSRSSKTHLKATIASEYYTSQKFAMEFTSKDGDSVSFSYESVEYSKNEVKIDAKGSSEEMKKLKSFVKDQLKKMSQEIVKNFLKDSGMDVGNNDGVEKADSDVAIPEYWNAENTSQRIVDFATSFFDAFEGKGEEFVKKIKDAIENGFSQAKNAFGGEFPGAAKDLVSDTHDLIMEKLDKWAKDKGINIDNQVETAEVEQ